MNDFDRIIITVALSVVLVLTILIEKKQEQIDFNTIDHHSRMNLV